MQVGIFGGSFDPVHYGHLLLAEYCRESAGLDRVVFMPATVSPHKRGSRPASADARIEMLELAIGAHPSFEVSRLEIERGGVSFTIDTLNDCQQLWPAAKLSFLMGADSLDDFPNWRDPQAICAIAQLLVVRRFGSRTPSFESLQDFLTPDQIAATKNLCVEMPRIELSSSDLRSRVAAGKSIRFQTPRAVEVYIEQHGLYQDGAPS